MDTIPIQARSRGHSGGFTLIELMIAVAIVSVLVATALPSYRDYARRSLRAEVQSYLTAAQVRQQQFLVDTRSYASTVADIGVPLPSRVQAVYDITLTIAAGPPQTYLIKATPKGDQSVEACGTLTVDHTGAKTAAKTNCW